MSDEESDIQRLIAESMLDPILYGYVQSGRRFVVPRPPIRFYTSGRATMFVERLWRLTGGKK